MTETEIAIAGILSARTAEHAFGPGPRTRDEIQARFKRMARLLHPDHVGKVARAPEALARLIELRVEAEKKIADGTYGKFLVITPVTIRTRDREYRNVEALAAGDLCDLYGADYTGGRAVIKLARDQRDEDLMTAEWSTLKKLWALSDDVSKNFQRYLPRLVESCKIAVDGRARRANVFAFSPHRNSLAEVLVARPRGIDHRDMAWMLRRVLEVLTWVHDQGIVHGAILPEHVLIRPDNHSIKLVGWAGSVAVGQTIKVMSTPRSAWYPPEVRTKAPASPATDLFMAGKLGIELCAGLSRMPMKVASLFHAATIWSPHRRYQDARDFYRRFDEVLQELYGPPSFRPFSLLPA